MKLRLRSALSVLWAASFGACSTTPPPGLVVEAPSAAPRASGQPLFLKNDVVAYRISDAAGAPIGRTHSTYLVSEDGYAQVLTRVELGAGEGRVQAEHATTFRPDLSPVRYKKLSSDEGRYELAFKGELWEIATDRGIQTIKGRQVQVPVLPDHDLMMLALVLDDARVGAGQSATVDVYAPSSRVTEPWALSVAAQTGGGLRVTIPGGQAELDAAGRIVRVTVEGRVYTPETPPGPPPEVRYDPPLSYDKPKAGRWTDRPLSVAVEGGVLAGVLSVPSDRGNWPERKAPAAVFVSRRGDQDRHGFQGSIDTGTWELADALVDHGLVVVRVDDRGVGASTSNIEPSARSLGLWVGDVLALVEAVGREPEVDPTRVFVVGHGLGAVPALLAAARGQVAGALLIGAPYHPLATFRTMAELEKGGDVAEADRRLRRVAHALRGDAQAERDAGAERVRAYRGEQALILDLDALDLPAELQKVKVPVAVVQGLKDIEVSWRDDAQPLVEALKKAAGKDKVRLLAFDRVDHLLKPEARQSSLARYADRSRRLDGEVLRAIAGWLHDTAKKPAASP